MYDYNDEDNRAYYEVKVTQEIMDNYPEGEDYKRCNRCGEILAYDSMSYHEDFHLDGCE